MGLPRRAMGVDSIEPAADQGLASAIGHRLAKDNTQEDKVEDLEEPEVAVGLAEVKMRRAPSKIRMAEEIRADLAAAPATWREPSMLPVADLVLVPISRKDTVVEAAAAEVVLVVEEAVEAATVE